MTKGPLTLSKNLRQTYNNHKNRRLRRIAALTGLGTLQAYSIWPDDHVDQGEKTSTTLAVYHAKWPEWAGRRSCTRTSSAWVRSHYSHLPKLAIKPTFTHTKCDSTAAPPALQQNLTHGSPPWAPGTTVTICIDTFVYLPPTSSMERRHSSPCPRTYRACGLHQKKTSSDPDPM
jgi:hypothetical protein